MTTITPHEPPQFAVYARNRPGERPLLPRVEQLVLSQKEVADYSLLRATDAARVGSWHGAGFEREISEELARRAGAHAPDPHTLRVPPQVLAPARRDLTVASPSGGGYLTDSPVLGVIDALRESSVAFRSGAQRLTGLRSNTVYARQGGVSTITWQALETTEATETSTLALGSISIAAKTVCAYIEESRHLRLMAPDLSETMIRRELRLSLATAVDQAAFAGTGSSGQPTGLLNTSGIGTFTGASLAYAGLLEAQTDILTANALTDAGRVGFVCRPAVASLLANRQGFSTNAPLWLGPLDAGRLVSCPALTSMNVPAATLVCGDFSQLVVAEFGAGLEIRVNPVAAFQAAIVGYGAFLTMDVAVLNPPSFSVATSVS